ncbi:huntingtin-interacting protein K [Aspergillus mulundensis]|uniref:Nascent polypeptide-associated complex subunit alpha-like UBA domain-containing protein n=1 Tax=Aspergillus mulundensis TaxID=1810919 RepID=A0A3D8S4V7_9EURO|nr:Uncharacterized protein DSM5745_04876 [Aspergillus mulundensis]RDW81319.1 Uncharacterized protein DSM5745_04876 [Aspergillus mulundensis]
MSDPIPSATTSSDPPPPSSSAAAEDRKAAAALSSLNTTEIASTTPPGSKLPSSADQEALGKAMGRLEMAAGGGKGKGATTAAKGGGASVGKAAEGKKKAVAAVKVSAEDVGLLVSELDLSKIKATELLKANEGDAKKALRAFIRPASAASVASA